MVLNLFAHFSFPFSRLTLLVSRKAAKGDVTMEHLKPDPKCLFDHFHTFGL